MVARARKDTDTHDRQDVIVEDDDKRNERRHSVRPELRASLERVWAEHEAGFHYLAGR